MKKLFLLTVLFFISNSSFTMGFADFVQQLERLRKEHSTINYDINTVYDEANVLLQLSKGNNSPRAINHLAGALAIIKKQYPCIKPIKINEGKWPTTIIRLSVLDHHELNNEYDQIINTMKTYRGFPLRLEDCIQRFKTVCLALVFPKYISIETPLKHLQNKISPGKINVHLYPSENDSPLEHIRLKKDKDKSMYHIVYVKKDIFYPYQRELHISYDYHRGSPIICHIIKETGNFNELPEVDKKIFKNWP